jgi:membrane protein DedA with SNARE-associated domain
MSFEILIISFGYIAIFLFLVSNGIFNFPSSQIIYLICGYLVYIQKLNLFLVVLFGAVGNSVGNLILYEITRKYGLSKKLRSFRILPFYYLKDEFLELLKKKFKKQGLIFLFFGKLISITKIFIPIIAGIGSVNRISYNLIIFITNLIWATIFVFTGFYFGKTVEFGLIFGIVFIIITIIFMYFFLKYLGISRKEYSLYFKK